MTEQQQKQLSGIVSGLQKKHGKENVLFGDDFEQHSASVERIGVSSPKITNVLGGGIPRGRIIEVYGPESSSKTSLASYLAGQVQQSEIITPSGDIRNGIVAFIDAEHALDPDYAATFGFDVKQAIFSQPNSGEQALDIAISLAESGQVDFIVIDSVAALTPQAEIEGEMGDQQMGLQARLMSKACRKLTAILGRTKTTILFINQIRMKIGVMFGCFSYDARVVLADGSVEKIGKIVNQKLDVEVRSFDPVTGEVKPARVIDWHKNGNTDEWVDVVAQRYGGNGKTQFKATENHIVFTPGMIEKPIGELSVGDELLIQAEYVFNSQQTEVALSQVLGDGSVRHRERTAQLRIGHGGRQSEYARWKASIFGELVGWDDGSTHFDLIPSADLIDIEDSPELISKIGILGLALWYLDDGTFSGYYKYWGNGKSEISVKRWTNDQRERAADLIDVLIGVRPTVTKNGRLLFSGKRNRIFQEAISSYVPPCMQYKLHPNYQGKYNVSVDSIPNRRIELIPSKIISVDRVTAQPRRRTRFDITVEGTHGYLVDGCAVHNSPETTSGGNALKFYSSIRLETRRVEWLTGKSADDLIGMKARIKGVKNKVAPPMVKEEVEILFGKGYQVEKEWIDFAIVNGILEKAGSWIKYNGENLGQGKDNVANMLLQSDELYDEIKEKTISVMNPAIVPGGE